MVAVWRARADSFDTAARGYDGKCVSVKGVQLRLRAIEVRKCADELEKINGKGSNPEAKDPNVGISLELEALAEEQLKP